MKLRDWKTITICLVLLLALLAGGGYVARKGYVSIRQKRLIKQAKEFLTKSEEKKALLSLQRALRINPKDVEANRLMANLAEAARSPATLMLRGRVVELVPDSTEDRLALARAGMIFGDPIAATNALAGIRDADKKTSAYHNLAGTIFAGMRQFDVAETHFTQAATLEPTNPAPRLNLAVIRLQQTNAQDLASARASLKELTAVPQVRSAALRELLGDALRHQQTNTALSLSADLLKETNAPFSDKLLRLDVLRIAHSPEFNPSLGKFQAEAAAEVARVAELATWQMTRLGPDSTLSWFARLPAVTRTNTPVALVTAEAYMALKQWKNLQTTLEPLNWGDLELMRHAYLARALRGQDLASSAKTEWEQSMKLAGGNKNALTMLLRMTAQWRWENEAEEILWAIVNRFPAEKWAVAALNQAFYMSGRTRSLMGLYSQLAKTNPKDLDLQNNLAMAALLLDAQEIKPHDIARDVYAKANTNASYASTYAFSLYLQDKPKEALQIFQKIDPKKLEDPSNANYYGLILKAAGNPAEAKKYFALGAKAPMLPEEKKLFDKAKSGL
jgi:tetratricopeptide (TPR) repeat protein